MRAASRIIRIQAGHANAYLIMHGEFAVLVDTGSRPILDRVKVHLAEEGLAITDLRFIVLTHSHYDHVCEAGAIRAESGAQVIAHAAEATNLARGCTPLPHGTSPLFRLISWIGRRFFGNISCYAPVPVDIAVTGAFCIPAGASAFVIIPTPGHTIGSISVLFDGHAFVGDSCFRILPWSCAPPFADDGAALHRSWDALLATGCHTFHPCHGTTFGAELLWKTATR